MFLELGEFGKFFGLLFVLNILSFVGFNWLFICGVKFFWGLKKVFLLNRCGLILVFSGEEFIEVGERGL